MRKNSFDMESICAETKKRLRKERGIPSTRSFIRAVWKDYIYLSLIPHLLKYGKVQVDKNLSIEIVGRRNNNLIFLKKSKELSSSSKQNMLRPNIAYKIVVTDNTYKKGKLTFTATQYIKKQVHLALTSTSNYYRIAS